MDGAKPSLGANDPHGPEVPPDDRPGRFYPGYDADLDPATQYMRAVDPRPTLLPGARRGRDPHHKRRRATVLAASGAVAASLTLIAVIGSALGSRPLAPGEESAQATAPVSEQAEANDPSVLDDRPFRLTAISATGERLSVAYTDGGGGTAVEDVPSGWSETVPNQDGIRSNRFSASTGNEGGSSGDDGTITCRVTQVGNLVAEKTVTGQPATAKCGSF